MFCFCHNIDLELKEIPQQETEFQKDDMYESKKNTLPEDE